MRGEDGVTGEEKFVGVPKCHSLDIMGVGNGRTGGATAPPNFPFSFSANY